MSMQWLKKNIRIFLNHNWHIEKDFIIGGYPNRNFDSEGKNSISMLAIAFSIGWIFPERNM